MDFIALIVAIFAFSFAKSARDEVRQLKNTSQVSVPTGSIANNVEIPATAVFPEDLARMSALQSAEMSATPLVESADRVDAFSQWIKEDWIMKLGAFFLLIGFGWFVTYAFMEGWIGPVGRITLGIIMGAAIMVGGFYRTRTFVHQGPFFIAFGAGLVSISVFAARAFYDFFGPVPALGTVLLVSLFTATASIRFNVRWLGFMSILLSGFAPMLTDFMISSSGDTALFLSAYLIAIALGGVLLAAITGWRDVILLVLGVATIYDIQFWNIFGHNDVSEILFILGIVLSLVLYVTNIAAIMRTRAVLPADSTVAVWNGILLLLWIIVGGQNGTFPQYLQSMVAMIPALVFGVTAYLVFVRTQIPQIFYVYGSLAAAFIAAATTFELADNLTALIIAYTIEIALMSFTVFSIGRNLRSAYAILYLMAVPLTMALGAGSFELRRWNDSLFDKDAITVLLFLAVFAMLASVYGRVTTHLDGESRNQSKGVGFLRIITGILAATYLWNTMHVLVENEDMATMLALLVYAVTGIALYFQGIADDSPVLRRTGGIILGLVTLYLLLVSAAEMDMVGRIITFFVIGIALFSTAFIGRSMRGPQRGA
ncbi:MAG: hypothetical protein A2408_03375 [Candidatus Yonathbacteria bacterium RIFOXYC1_FULL_52_10]|uniref:DUF2339 domain-containing protein n=1 Tax=Candidatus Yonathbacteria bacterium RIFOXYD1_FULL_52_36 TaxID=1802730 RepID=A0A1G2SL36_9BACT|nr:MAG: hypothetical protein A2408_03375 [Candidatus Yonathbacteria bacterium RIFOXYC1_FULL_52_10]OHA85734.1 MAG: hypothetical protein A2591_02155 [Candidatus Yonathbacteria bacterium RIFOXYD1_FULL_52_36]